MLEPNSYKIFKYSQYAILIVEVKAWFFLYEMGAHDVNKVFFQEKKIGYDDSFGVTKCLQQIEMRDLLHVCA